MELSKVDIYTKARGLLRFSDDDIWCFASRASSGPTISQSEVYGLSVQLKTTRAIGRFLNFTIRILGPEYITKEEHPSRFYRSVYGKLLLCLFQPILCFRKLLLNFEVCVYAGYFGKISREHYEMLKPHPDFCSDSKMRSFAPKQQS